VPSALTYRMRQIEDALDVLLFDRRSRQARLTEAGAELLREGARLLQEIDAVANRVRAWPPAGSRSSPLRLTASSRKPILMELAEAFFALDPPTRLRIRDEALSGTLEALVSGRATWPWASTWTAAPPPASRQAAGAAGVCLCRGAPPPAGRRAEPLADELLQKHRAVAVADSVQQRQRVTLGLLGGQDVFTVSSMPPSWMHSCAAGLRFFAGAHGRALCQGGASGGQRGRAIGPTGPGGLRLADCGNSGPGVELVVEPA
jgi:DNA-binding transcriptional LysR family regulator